MAIKKYPNYLEELFRSKLKENELDCESNNKPIKHEQAFKFINLSEDCLKLAVQLARRDVKEGNIKQKFINKITPIASSHLHNHDDKPDSDDESDVDDSDDIHQTTRHVLKVKSKDLPIRSMSPPIRDENSKPIRAKRSTTFISEREMSLKLETLKKEIVIFVGQIQILASVQVKKRSSKSEDPTEEGRREMRVNERSNRINRLTYDLGRGTKDFLQEIKRGKRQECLKRLIHFYKESLKIVKMITMQMSDSSNPKMFLRSKIFIDLGSVFSDLSIAMIELNPDQNSMSNVGEPAYELKSILESFNINHNKSGMTPLPIYRHPAITAPPCSPRSPQDFNNNIAQQQQQPHKPTIQHSSPIIMSEEQFQQVEPKNDLVSIDKRNNPIEVEVIQDQTSNNIHHKEHQISNIQHKEQSSKVGIVDDPSSRKRILNQYLRILVERNDGLMKNELMQDEIKNTDLEIHWKDEKVVNSKENNNALQNKMIKSQQKGSHRVLIAQRKSIDLNHQPHPKISSTPNCRHEPQMENKINRSKSSPPTILTNLNKGAKITDKDLKKKNKFGANRKALTKKKLSGLPNTPKRTSSLSVYNKCPNCGICLQNRLHSNQPEVIKEESLQFGDNYFIESQIGDDDDDDEVSISDSYSTITRQNISTLSDKLKQFEMDRKKMKVRWASYERGDGGMGDEPPFEVQETCGKPFIENFEEEFKRDVAMAKDIFRHQTAGGEPQDRELPCDFSLRLLQDWDRRDREFLSFRLFNGESRDDNPSIEMPYDEIDVVNTNESVNITSGRKNDHQITNDDDVKFASKIMGISHFKEPVNLSMNRDVIGELVMKSATLKDQIKERIMQVLDGAPGDGVQNAFLSSGIAKDLLEDCFHEVCNEADYVSNEIVNRVYKSELSTNRHDS